MNEALEIVDKKTSQRQREIEFIALQIVIFLKKDSIFLRGRDLKEEALYYALNNFDKLWKKLSHEEWNAMFLDN
jgi:hypothetical protein